MKMQRWSFRGLADLKEWGQLSLPFLWSKVGRGKWRLTPRGGNISPVRGCWGLSEEGWSTALLALPETAAPMARMV